MNTPICDFVEQYIRSDTMRLHMPGHKGQDFLGTEHLDITEIPGADNLYQASGIIARSEENAGVLFGCPTYYSTEGSSHCIRAMLHLAVLDAEHRGKTPRVAAGRNAHKAFFTAAALLDVDVVWLYPENQDSYLVCTLTPDELDKALAGDEVTAVYLTSPDYLGSVANIAALSEVCHKHGALLLVDNAHGAYLRFLPVSRHPMDLGADMCCDSAHKTLPVLTGGAYLHVRSPFFAEHAKKALALFGSTSPSYLILQSLDAANLYLEAYPQKLAAFITEVGALKERLTARGWRMYGDEPLKLTLCTSEYGYTGQETEALLAKEKISCEFAEPDYLVLMLTPETGTAGLKRLEAALSALPRGIAGSQRPPQFENCRQVLPLRRAMLSLSESVPVEQAVGRILASPCVGCPPAVAIAVCGQLITDKTAAAFRYYNITHCDVIIE